MVLTGQVHGAIETARQVRFRGADDLALSSPQSCLRMIGLSMHGPLISTPGRTRAQRTAPIIEKWWPIIKAANIKAE